MVYYLLLHKRHKINKLLYFPDELNVELYVHKSGRLIYSFYNPTKKRNINLRGVKIPEYFPPNMNVKQVASYLNVADKTISKWTSEGKIPFTKIGNAVKYRKIDLDKLLDKNTKQPRNKK